MTDPEPYEIRLETVLKNKDLRVRDVYGYMSEEFGDPVFKITRVIMSDGSALNPEGEHDMPYIPSQRGTDFPEVKDEE